MKLRSKIVLWVIGAVWIAAMLALIPRFVSISDDTSSVEHVFSDYGTALVNHRFQDAYRLCSSSFQSAMPYDQFVRFQNKLETQYGKLESVDRKALKVHCDGSGCSAALSASLAYQTKTVRYRFVLYKDGGRWVIFGGEQL